MESENIWAIVITGITRLIGVVHGVNTVSSDIKTLKENIVGCFPCCAIQMSPVYELHVNYIQAPDRKTGITILQQQVHILPYALTTDSKTPVYIMADSIQFLADMSPEDFKRYKEIIDKGEEMSLKARAQASGIQLVGPQDMPKS